MIDFKKIQTVMKIAEQAHKQSERYGKILNENNKLLKKITQQLDTILLKLKNNLE